MWVVYVGWWAKFLDGASSFNRGHAVQGIANDKNETHDDDCSVVNVLPPTSGCSVVIPVSESDFSDYFVEMCCQPDFTQ